MLKTAAFATAWRCSKVILPFSLSRRWRTLVTISSSGREPDCHGRCSFNGQRFSHMELVLIEVGVREQDPGNPRGQLDRRAVGPRSALVLALEGAEVAQRGVLMRAR